MKPYYKLTIGKKPYTSADMRFPSGRIFIQISDHYPNASMVLASLVDVRWGSACVKLLNFFDASTPVSITDHRALGLVLTEPPERTLRAEVARLSSLRSRS